MSGKLVAGLAGIAIAVQASILWVVNGWTAANGFMYIIASVLIVGAIVAWHADRDD